MFIFKMVKTQKITNNVSILVKDDKVFLFLKKYKPIIVSADDKCRKGVELSLCSKCKTVSLIVMSCGDKDYCDCCTNKHFTKIAKDLVKERNEDMRINHDKVIKEQEELLTFIDEDFDKELVKVRLLDEE